jgi:rubrerythrin
VIVATSKAILASLNEDLALEHGAIVQYAIHGLQLRDASITDPVRRMAREEMWHFEWLAEAIRDRGGTLSLDRADVFLSASIGDSMAKDVDTEDLAIGHYAKTLDLVGRSDPELSALIERIVDDEHSHRRAFAQLAERVRADGDAPYTAHALAEQTDIPVIGQTLGLEYAAVLQYLWNKYECGDCEAGEMHFELAIDEMRHLGWVGAYLPGVVLAPVAPAVPVDRVREVSSPEGAADAARQLEQQAASHYAHVTLQAHSVALAGDLARAASQHEYHRFRLGAQDNRE